MASKGVEIIVRGEVQGVGFRWFIHKKAMDFGVNGYVRNRSDGAVEVYAEGEGSAVDALLAVVRVGPRSARVEEVTVDWRQPTGNYSNFEIAYD